jgi:hypothetical protein
MESFRIVALSVLAAVVYGVAHDLVTAHVCVEYFSLFHPPVIDSNSPVALAFVWGVIATWWVGLPLGVLLAIAARAGSAPKWDARRLVRPVAALLGSMALVSLVAGITGAALGATGAVFVVGEMAERLPPERHVRFLADLWAHSASYAAAAIGGVALVIWAARRRRNPIDLAVGSRP